MMQEAVPQAAESQRAESQRAGPPGTAPGSKAPRGVVLQATVRGFDASARSGSVFTDDGAVLEFGPAAFGASGLRLLRPGQRVRLRRAEGGQVTALALVTFPLPPDETGPEA